MAVGGCS
jgi:hypothetical protein